MSKHLPPVPPENQSTKGPGGESPVNFKDANPQKQGDRNYDQQGRQGNSKINTTHQGYQQDR